MPDGFDAIPKAVGGVINTILGGGQKDSAPPPPPAAPLTGAAAVLPADGSGARFRCQA